MEFYFYVYLSRPSIRIHRGTCSFCRPIKSPLQPAINQENNYWSGPYSNYGALLSEARAHGQSLGISPENCKRCQPARFALDADQKGTELGSMLQDKTAIVPVSKLKALRQTHQQEERELTSFYANIQALLQTRHQSQRLEQVTHGVGQDRLLLQQAQEKEELLAGQLNSYRLLKEEQAKAIASLMRHT